MLIFPFPLQFPNLYGWSKWYFAFFICWLPKWELISVRRERIKSKEFYWRKTLHVNTNFAACFTNSLLLCSALPDSDPIRWSAFSCCCCKKDSAETKFCCCIHANLFISRFLQHNSQVAFTPLSTTFRRSVYAAAADHFILFCCFLQWLSEWICFRKIFSLV